MYRDSSQLISLKQQQQQQQQQPWQQAVASQTSFYTRPRLKIFRASAEGEVTKCLWKTEKNL